MTASLRVVTFKPGKYTPEGDVVCSVEIPGERRGFLQSMPITLFDSPTSK
jgi:hypothetical protein